MLNLPPEGERFCCSWSGGKDCCLALYRAVAAGAHPQLLLTMFTEDDQRTRSHGLPRAVIERQAALMSVPLATAATSWDDYEVSLIRLLTSARHQNIAAAVFGDIDILRHRQWEEHVCQAADLGAYLPLWQHRRESLLEEWWRLGFEARIVVVRDGVLGRQYLGRLLDAAMATELQAMGIDACGENGEFHTVVTGGPLFTEPLRLELGEQFLRCGCWFQDIAVI